LPQIKNNEKKIIVDKKKVPNKRDKQKKELTSVTPNDGELNYVSTCRLWKITTNWIKE
jgi:hypothetical protein